MFNIREIERLLCLIFDRNETKYLNSLLYAINHVNCSFSQTIMFRDDNFVKIKTTLYGDGVKLEIKNNLNCMVFYV